ncbi:MAG: hypothetical protein JO022_16255, partial [Acidobacteriaceae bacterium]|nr:hypothetical protein [Acidobacteriaceae bacterium]
GAVQALADAGSREAELLLRLKVSTGDKEAEVIGACFAALLEMAPARSEEFCTHYLRNGTDDEVEAAALALGEAKRAGALESLKQAWSGRRDPQVRRTLLVSIALLRDVESISFLLERLKQDPPFAFPDVLAALDVYRHDEAVAEQIRTIREARKL